MNVTSILPVSGDSSLPELQAVIRQREQILQGTLIAMSPYDEPERMTWITFSDTPAPNGEVELKIRQEGDDQDGLICIGDCYVSGNLIRVEAYRT